jgi:hypothetical protein
LPALYLICLREFSITLHYHAGFLTDTAEDLFKIIWGLQPRDIGDTAAGPLSKEEKVKVMIEDLLDKLPELFNMQDLMSKVNIIEYPRLYLSKNKTISVLKAQNRLPRLILVNVDRSNAVKCNNDPSA